MLCFHEALPCGFCERRLGGDLLFKLCDRACLTVACGGDLEVLDVSPMFQTGAFGKLIPGGVDEVFLGIISDDRFLPDGERRTLFVLYKFLFRNALPDPFFGVFSSQRLCAATDKTLPVQRAEGDNQDINKAIKRISKAYNAYETVRAEQEERAAVLLPYFTCHYIRHTFCTRLCEHETNLKVIQSIMGHTSIKTTMDIYAETTEKKKQETFETLQNNNVFF